VLEQKLDCALTRLASFSHKSFTGCRRIAGREMKNCGSPGAVRRQEDISSRDLRSTLANLPNRLPK
jgi:hypothetical protein